MAKPDRIDNEVLRDAGLALMRTNGTPLTKLPSSGRSMLYAMPNGESVRIRTSNDHILVVVADRPTDDAHLNIQGTDWLLIVMPEVERAAGKVIAYLVPTEEAVEAVRKSHRAWLDSNPDTSGKNTTWNLWFDHSYSGMASRQGKHEYAERWAKYRLAGDISTEDLVSTRADEAGENGGSGNIRTEVEAARQRIAHAACVPPNAVKISIDFAA